METKEKGDSAERRKAKRTYASFVEYCRAEDVSSKKFQAFTENISTTGICIFINEDIELNSFLYITVYLLDGSAPIETKGKIAWIRPSTFLNIEGKKHFDAGIEFVEITKEDRDRLIYYTSKYGYEIPPSKK
jgi:Tfp pilus assembly protein PilZ